MTQIQKLIPIKFPIQRYIILVHLEKFLILLCDDVIKIHFGPGTKLLVKPDRPVKLFVIFSI